MTSKLLAAVSVAPIDAVLTWLIQSTVLLTVGLLAGRFLRRRGPAVQSALYRTILVAVLVCPIASLASAAMGLPGLVIRVPVAAAGERNEVADRGPDRVGPIARQGSAAIPAVEPAQALDRLALPVGAATTAGPPSVVGTGTTPGAAKSATGPTRRMSILLSSWLLGAAFLALRLLVGHRRMARLRGTAIPAEAEAQALCHELAGRMRLRLPGVLRSPFLCSPCLDGLRRPAILLPEDADQHLRDTFVHELAHLGRRDGLWNLIRQLATAALWMQPLLWVLSRRIEETAEEVCDDFVVAFGADRCRYAGHLLALADRRLPPPAPAGVGMISLRSLLARRIARILDSTRSLSTRAGRRTLTATLLAGLAATILAGLVGVGRGSRNLLADEPKSARSVTGKAIETSEPPAAARDEQGKAAARDVPITGRIVDLEGRPIAGVTVHVSETSKARGGDLTPWLEAVRRGEPPWVAYRHLEEDKEKPSGKAETDAQGRFRLEGLGAEKRVLLSIEGTTIAYTTLEVVTRRIASFPARGFANEFGPGTQTVYGAEFTFTASPGRVVEGVVRDERTREVMKDVEVRSFRFAGSNYVGIKNIKTRTNAEGRFRLAGFPKGDGSEMLIVPNDDQPYFMQVVDVPDPSGLGPVTVQVGLHRGTWIEGKLTDKETGAPVAGAFLHYLPFLENRFAQATPEFRGGVYRAGSGYQDRYQSKADGTYRLVGVAGRAIVGAVVYSGKLYRRGAGAETIEGMNEHGHFATASNPVTASRYFPTSMKEIDPTEGTEVVHLDLELDPGAKVRLRVVDQEAKPLTGVKTGGRRERGRNEFKPEAQFEFDVETLGPGEDRIVSLVHEGRKLGRVIHVREGEGKDDPVVVALEPAATITGRVVDPEGNPVSGVTIRPGLKPGGDYSLSLPQVVSGTDGRFTVPNVPTGCDYSLVAESRASSRRRWYAFKDAAVRPGETTDAGDIRLKD
jgi:beta-lactamase regulating signal transducer with metallopeptidase domain